LSSSSCRQSPPPHPSRERRLPPSRVVLRLAVGDETSCSPCRDPEIPRDRTRCPTSLHRKPPPPQSTPPTADSVESTMPRSSETFMRSAQTGAIARAARRTAWWNLMLSSIIGLPDGGSPGTELIITNGTELGILIQRSFVLAKHIRIPTKKMKCAKSAQKYSCANFALSPRLRQHGDSQTVDFLPAKTPPRHFQVVL
jgi:hypothetical protein